MTEADQAVAMQEASPFTGVRSRWLLLILIPCFFVSQYVIARLGSLGLYPIQLILVLWLLIVVNRTKLSLNRLIGKIPASYNWWPIFFIAVLILVFSVGSSVLIAYPLLRYAPDLFESWFLSDIIHPDFHLFIAAAIIAPVIEEPIFRGLLFSRLTIKWGATKALIGSSILFGILHPLPIGAFTFGLVACLLYIRTNTLKIPIALHVVHNLIVWGLATNQNSEMSAIEPGELAYAGLVCTVLAAPLLFGLRGKWWPAKDIPIPYTLNRD